MAVELKNHTPSLYLFGDSFSVPSTAVAGSDSWVDWQWSVQLSDLMGLELKALAEFGVSNEWIISRFNFFLDQYKSGDHIIIQTTESSRYWYFQDKPWVSNPFGLVDDLVGEKILTPKENDAMRAYINYIHTDEKDWQRQQMMYAYLNTMRWALGNHGIQVHILPGFDQPQQFPIAVNGGELQGCLQHVSKNEFISHEHGEEWYAQPNTPDQRLNHLSRDNHDRLAKRLYDHFNGESINFINEREWLSGYLSIETQRADQLCPSTIKHNMK